MTSGGYLPFDTAIGRCAVAWGERGITRVWLPEAPDRPAAGAAPPTVERAVEDIRALLDGDPRDLRAAPLDLADVPAFHRDVYAVARDVAPGETISYGDIARRLGDVALSRAVG